MPVDDPVAAVLSQLALATLQQWVEAAVEQLLRERLPAEIERIRLTPWLDTKHAAAYLAITENALRLRVRQELVPAHRDSAGRLRFHRGELDQSMSVEPPRRRQRR